MQVVPGMLNAEKETYLRFSAWRVTRTIAQTLAKLGGTFEADGGCVRCFEPPGKPEKVEPYCAGFRTDFKLGDDPYRYKRW